MLSSTFRWPCERGRVAPELIDPSRLPIDRSGGCRLSSSVPRPLLVPKSPLGRDRLWGLTACSGGSTSPDWGLAALFHAPAVLRPTVGAYPRPGARGRCHEHHVSGADSRRVRT